MKILILLIIISISILFVVNTTLSMPDVYVSNSTGDCMAVINYEGSLWSCENLPSKYNHIWVK